MASSIRPDSDQLDLESEPILNSPNDYDPTNNRHIQIPTLETHQQQDEDTPNKMQRSASRSAVFGSLTNGGNGGFFTAKNGAIDKHKTILVFICSILFLYIFYDVCHHYHLSSLDDSIADIRDQQRATAGDAQSVPGILTSPGSPDGALPTSAIFTYTDSQQSSYLNKAGVMAFPIQAEHELKKKVNGIHVATIAPGQTRGNHLHMKHGEVIVLVHGHFLLRVAKVGNDGDWIAEDHIYEIGIPSNPFGKASTISSTPIGIQIPPHVCHALRNIDSSTTAFFTSYYVLDQDAKREEPNREICKNQPKAFLH